MAMRLALVREYSRHVEPLPVVFDDIFVNFDPDRTRRSVEAVRELGYTKNRSWPALMKHPKSGPF